jgi:hypothetical protein
MVQRSDGKEGFDMTLSTPAGDKTISSKGVAVSTHTHNLTGVPLPRTLQ